MNPRYFKNWVEAFEIAHKETELPPNYVFWAGVGAIAGALERKVYYNGVRFRLYPNHFITFTGPPAIKKSTTVNLAIDHLRELQTVNVGPSSVTWQFLVDKLVKLNWGDVEDIKAGGQLKYDTAPMTLPAPELGTLVDFTNREFLDFMCVLWDSPKNHEKSTRGMGDQMIWGPCVNILSGTTPEWIRDNIKPTMFKTGLLTRFIFVFANDVRREIAFPEDHVDEQYVEALKRLDSDLIRIHSLKGQVHIDKDAKEIGAAYYSRVVRETKSLSDHTKDWSARRHVHVIKLAICISAAKRDSLVITKEDYQQAINKIEEAHQDLYKVLAYMEERKELGPMRAIELFIRLKGDIAVKDVYENFYRVMLRREVDEAIAALAGSGNFEKYANNATQQMHIKVKDGK